VDFVPLSSPILLRLARDHAAGSGDLDAQTWGGYAHAVASATLGTVVRIACSLGGPGNRHGENHDEICTDRSGDGLVLGAEPRSRWPKMVRPLEDTHQRGGTRIFMATTATIIVTMATIIATTLTILATTIIGIGIATKRKL
jgi:hypothetical protein